MSQMSRDGSRHRSAAGRGLGILPSIGLVAVATALFGWVLEFGAGWRPSHVLTGLAAYAVLGAVVAITAIGRHGTAGFGLPNQVTLLRAGLVCLAGGALWASGVGGGWSLPALVALALVLDLLDGWLARRLDLVSAFGARFDMEVDALFLLILALLVWHADQTGVWVLLIGLLRYAFVLAGLLRPELRRPLVPSFRRKAVCGVQGAVLLVCLLPPVPPAIAAVLALGALTGLIASFAIDVASLLGRTTVPYGRLDRSPSNGIFETEPGITKPGA